MLDIALQNFIFSNPSRLDLVSYQKKRTGITKKIAIYRNHSFEFIESTIAPYLEFAGYDVEFTYSDYDDTLSFFNIDAASDALIVWLDVSRYSMKNANEFIKSRLEYLVEIYKKPILIALLGKNDVKKQFFQFPINDIAKEIGESFWDYKREYFTGSKISSRAMLRISMELGLNYIPSMLCAPLKAVVIDLDNTLYAGTLGEDGINGIKIDEKYKYLQNSLLQLKKQGILLAVASKNEASDVERMFKVNNAFEIKYEDFSKVCATWENKSISISKIARFLNIGFESILFVDDNPGELAEVELALPEVKKLLANKDSRITAEMIRNYPGIKRWGINYEDVIRDSDIRANEKRRELQSHMSQQEYIQSLHMKLCYFIDDSSAQERIAELANKTNQFIFSYKRYTLATIKNLMESQNSAVVSVSLKDDLSDSGIIAVFVGKKEEKTLLLDECFISCRALGRGIELLLVQKGIHVLMNDLETEKLKVNFIEGERNCPARDFVYKYLKKYIDSENTWEFRDNGIFVEITIKNEGVTYGK